MQNVEKIGDFLFKSDSEQSYSETTTILEKNTQFSWNTEASAKWCYLSQQQLARLVGLVGDAIGITPEQAENIVTIFSDNFHTTYPETESIACCFYGTQDGQTKTYVSLNRSFANYAQLYQVSKLPDNTELLHLREISDTILTFESGLYRCILKSPLEALLMMLVEELHHAKVKQISLKKGIDPRNNYQKYINAKVPNSSNLHSYRTNIIELAASRVVAEFMYTYHQATGDQKRAIYFQKLKQACIENQTTIAHDYSLIAAKLFI